MRKIIGLVVLVSVLLVPMVSHAQDGGDVPDEWRTFRSANGMLQFRYPADFFVREHGDYVFTQGPEVDTQLVDVYVQSDDPARPYVLTPPEDQDLWISMGLYTYEYFARFRAELEPSTLNPLVLIDDGDRSDVLDGYQVLQPATPITFKQYSGAYSRISVNFSRPQSSCGSRNDDC